MPLEGSHLRSKKTVMNLMEREKRQREGEESKEESCGGKESLRFI